jgi:hypothetical protein
MRVRGACACALLGCVLGLSGCRTHRAAATMDDLARAYAGLSVQLGARDADSLDFAIGADAATEALRRNPQSLYALHRSALALRDQVSALPAGGAGARSDAAARKALLLGQIDAMVLRTEQLLGNDRSFDAESRVLFGVVAPEDHEAEARRRVRARVAALLGGAGHSAADPAAAYARFDAQFIVPPERVPAVMMLALQQCRAITLQHMTLPAGEHVDLAYVGHKPWAAFSRYLGDAHSLIELNMDYPLTVDRLLELACHEGYPGHHVFNTLRDLTLAQGSHRAEFTVQPTFSPQSFVSEAAASYAPELALSAADRLHIERDLLASAAGLRPLDFVRYLALQRAVAALHTAEPSIAREYLDGRLEFVRAADALARETLMVHAEPTLLYLNEYRTYMLAYTLGQDRVQALVEAGQPSDAERWRRYVALMTGPVVSLPSPPD